MELNIQQQKIVDAPVNQSQVVIAGAGTGKTHVVISRIKRLLSCPDVSPYQILAISFSRETRNEMEKRLKRDIGSNASKITMATFHSLGLKILTTHYKKADVIKNVKTFSENELVSTWRKFLSSDFALRIPYRLSEDSLERGASVKAAVIHKELDDNAKNRLQSAFQYVVSRLHGNPTLPYDLPFHVAAQEWATLCFPPKGADFNAQLQNYQYVKNDAYYQATDHNMTIAHNIILQDLINRLQATTDFKLRNHWCNVLLLNSGSLDVSGLCYTALQLFKEDPAYLGNSEHYYVHELTSAQFSSQNLLDYILRRKDMGVLPQINMAKYDYYEQNLNEAWSFYHPCDLRRLRSIAPESMKKSLYCPFKKDVNLKRAEGNRQAKVREETEKERQQHPSVPAQTKVNGNSGFVYNQPATDAPKSAQVFLPLFSEKASQEESCDNSELCSCSFCPYFLDWYEIFFALYEKWRESNRFLDFPEQINRCVRVLKFEPHLCQQLQNDYRFIFVDEFQDTNPVQYDLLQLLKSQDNAPVPNYICVVGDDDQAIYGWRGADFHCLDRVSELLKIQKQDYYPLTINYRSHQNILNIANNLIKYNKQRIIDKRLVCPQAFAFENSNPNTFVGYDPSSPRVNIIGIDDYTLEIDALSQAVEYLHDNLNVPYSEIAVLFRTNHMAVSAEFAMLRQSIPYYTKDTSFVERPIIRTALAVLRLSLDPNDDEAMLIYGLAISKNKYLEFFEQLIEMQHRQKLKLNLADAVANPSDNGYANAGQFSDGQFNDGYAYQGDVEGYEDGYAGSGVDVFPYDDSIDSKLKQLDRSTEKMYDLGFTMAKQTSKRKKAEQLLGQVGDDPQHKYTKSLYTLMSEVVKDSNLIHKSGNFSKTFVDFCDLMLYRVNNVKDWRCDDDLSLDGVMNLLFMSSDLYQIYNLSIDEEDDESEDMGSDNSKLFRQFGIVCETFARDEQTKDEIELNQLKEQAYQRDLAKRSAVTKEESVASKQESDEIEFKSESKVSSLTLSQNNEQTKENAQSHLESESDLVSHTHLESKSNLDSHKQWGAKDQDESWDKSNDLSQDKSSSSGQNLADVADFKATGKSNDSTNESSKDSHKGGVRFTPNVWSFSANHGSIIDSTHGSSSGTNSETKLEQDQSHEVETSCIAKDSAQQETNLQDIFNRTYSPQIEAEAKYIFDQMRLERLQADPVASKELLSYPISNVELRSRMRKFILQLTPHCKVPWSKDTELSQHALHKKQGDEKVSLLTIHASKGREYQAVIILGFEDRLLPHISSQDDANSMEEERRLAYVALTRAKRYLVVTFSRNRPIQQDQNRPTGRSSFLREALSSWYECSKENRPYHEKLISFSDFFTMQNVWEGRIDP